MPITRIVKGDLIALAKENKFDGIAHGCNCFNRMGAGIAPKINKAFTNVLDVDFSHVPRVGSLKRLGTYSVSIQDFDGIQGCAFLVFNLYTQYSHTYIKNNPPVDYSAVKSVFESLNKLLPDGFCLGIPKIGAGLAGGDWDKIEHIINTATPNLRITLVEYQPK